MTHISNAIVDPKPARRPWPTLWAGGESETAKNLIARDCDAYAMHGDPADRIAAKIADMQRVSLEDYSVSNRGLRSGLTGTPERVAERLLEFERSGADLVLLQFSPQAEEIERFAEQVIPLVRGERAAAVA